MAVTNPVALGLVASLAHPGRNATGLSNVHVELTQKRLALLKELMPAARKVGVPQPPGIPDITAYMAEIGNAAKALDFDVHVEAVNGPETLNRVFTAMKTARVAGVMLISDPFTYTHRARLVELSNNARIPLIGWAAEFHRCGGATRLRPEYS